MKTLGYFTGRWEAVQMEGRTVTGWKLFKYYEQGSFVWIFNPKGVLIEQIKGRPDFETLYSYFHKDQILHIDRARYDPDRHMATVCITNSYWVEPISDNECWVYDLTDVRNGPDKCRFRIKIKKS